MDPDDSGKDLYQYLIDPISTVDLPLKDGVNRNKKGLGIEGAILDLLTPTAVPHQIHSQLCTQEMAMDCGEKCSY